MKRLVFESYIDIDKMYSDVIEVILVLIGVYIVFKVIYYFKRDPRIKIFQKLYPFVLILGFMEMTGKPISYYYYQDAIKNHSYKELTGVISEFVPMPKDGHVTERFKVSNVQFYVRHTSGSLDAKKTLFYELTKTHGGPIKENGQKVTVQYISSWGKNRIIKMWVYE